MEEQLILESLSPIERAVLPTLDSKEFIDLGVISGRSGQESVTTIRAVGFLKNKGLVETREEIKKEVGLGILGVNYLKKGLPERILLNKLSEKKVIPIGEIKNICSFNTNEATVALGTLKKKEVVRIEKGKVYLDAKSVNISSKMIEEIFLEKLPLEMSKFSKEDKEAFENLLKRKEIIEPIETKKTFVKLTDLGKKILKSDWNVELLENLTPKILKQNSWKGKKFRRYDLNSPAPRMYGGKGHFVNQARDYAKSIWLEMGFKEMSGNLTETSFWVFDSLFTAQDHPVREMQDTFYIPGMQGKLPEKKNKSDDFISQVKKAHVGGLDLSKSWQSGWSEDEAKRVLMRTHTTALSVRKLREINEKKEFPAKYFALGKCFRNETVDWSHGFEFNQTEGIVVDENANFRHLLGYLKEFFKKMGYDKIRIRPAYFAYTEPSLEIDVFHPKHKKWVELGGAGMFRPEVTIPIFGRHIPVLAWGPGFDRIIMEYFDITDLRDMFKNDITKLREMKFWRRLD